MTLFHVAQINIARLRHPIDAPESAGFRDNIDRMNALGESQPGFVWRGVGPEFDAIDTDGKADPMLTINTTVWDSIEALAAFAYRTDHREFVRNRSDWFVDLGRPSLAIWWIEAGRVPSLADGMAKLDLLHRLGSTAEAFDFKTRFESPLSQLR